MSYELTGKLVTKYDTVQRTESFKTREFVIEVSDDNNGRTFTNFIKFQCVQDKTSMPDRFNIGDEVKVQFNIKGSKWEKDGKTNYITNQDNASSSPQQYVDAPAPDNSDDLPF